MPGEREREREREREVLLYFVSARIKFCEIGLVHTELNMRLMCT